MHLKPNPEDHGVISKQFLKKLCRSDFKNYYTTPSLNDVLYLHYKGFEKIDNLQEFIGLKVLYLQGNAFKRIEGLDMLTNLRCLYLQENLIAEIAGLDTLTLLSNLNLTDNMIERVTGLSQLTRLSNMQLKRNRIGSMGLEDVIGLLQCPSVSALDISDNRIETEQFVPDILMKMPNITVVYMQNNEFTKKITHYRKSVISRIPSLKYIDDRPIFEDELRYSQAWARGGLEEERKERALYKKEQEEKQIKQHNDFRDMLARHRADGRKEQEQAERAASSGNQSDSKDGSLETYKSPADSEEQSLDLSSKQSELSCSSEKGTDQVNRDQRDREAENNKIQRKHKQSDQSQRDSDSVSSELDSVQSERDSTQSEKDSTQSEDKNKLVTRGQGYLDELD